MKAYQQGWTLRRRVAALLGVVVVLLLGLAGAEAAVAAQNRQNIDAVLLKTGPLRVQAQELMSALLDQETSVRGYAVNGDRTDLEPYQEGVKREQSLAASIRDLSADYPDVRRSLDVVEQKTAQWRSQVAEPVISTVERDGAAAGQALITDATRQQFDGIRSSVNTLQDEILTVRQETADRVNATSNTLVVLLIIAALVVTTAGVVMLLSLDRILIRPLAALVGQVREVADGDYRHRIEGSGPPEFRRLAEDIDQMRMKIARELDEVREARERIEWVNSQLQKQAEELTRSNRDLEQFAYVASHDLQEPLRKVASFCQLLQRRYAGQLDERADQYIAFAVDGAQRMQRLINDLLAFSRIGRLTTGFTEVDLNKVMGDVAGQTEAAVQYADAELTWGEMPTIRGEEPLLTNLLVNLVSNSVKFRRPDVPPKVHVSARLVDGEWEISCRDNGIGIEPEFADKIFVIFQRLHSKDAYPGTGIGLAIVKKIVEYHGGRVWVDTDADEGTTIRFTLPALEADIEAAKAAEAAEVAEAGEQAEAAEGDPAAVGRQPDGEAREEPPAEADGHGTNGGMKETVG
ncbi:MULTISPECIES: sensor histidine kinase [Micromonospora]|uniref:sensor histidine kinase n=1 Tax=Micromonospora TaxID=1873 RepID=UPI0007DB2CEE|nr:MULTISPECIES: sensor histidine kinase [Micromonospora]MBQ1066712.1 CHASE3 domain-containing protein [Micromonospora sp. D75]NHO84856.1 HAMP domain-containing protein [Micromonospora sp. CMU55-4]RBQ07541.1 HAMP domain-containing protein [Micromonospora sp. LHW51205]WBB88543.1 CHASE3 domain-containing protein [Micromonospora sp. WMMC264]WDQ03173.1 CHASE3 domain-containing protein [Micromonospora chalcea]